MTAEAKYGMSVHPTSGLVRSQSNGAAAHQVTLASCDCADFINRRGRLVKVDGGIAVTLCKHIETFLLLIGGWNHPAEPEVHADLVNKQVTDILKGIGLGAGVVSIIVKDASDRGESAFPAGVAGARVGGLVTFDRIRGRYGVTLFV